jgi:hypothetical protein
MERVRFVGIFVEEQTHVMCWADGGVFRAPEKVRFSRRQDESTHIAAIGRLVKDRDTIGSRPNP